jgi:hypothetical protein
VPLLFSPRFKISERSDEISKAMAIIAFLYDRKVKLSYYIKSPENIDFLGFLILLITI